MQRTSSMPIRPLMAAAVVAVSLIGPTTVGAQTTRLVIDPELSLAWWQVNPHLGHLWATTCPGDPSWRPGEGISNATASGSIAATHMNQGYQTTPESRVPLYPRNAARPLCPEAVRGEIMMADTTSWRGVRGEVAVRAGMLLTGLRMRDAFARNAILNVNKFPEIRFRIDSLTSIQPGDTLRANAVGVLSLHGVDEPMTVPIRAWREADGLRVVGRFDIWPPDLVEKYHMSIAAIGIGITSGIWQKLHLGLDFVLKPAGRQQE